ncbi:MAG: GTP 3',8-cyclase MoaA [Candidatus Polarisedimenticolaceae bacterium]|nr:GTP 3',8-cyclase MoaA [Candidatus Polarisedimenticolaceae bacterium]
MTILCDNFGRKIEYLRLSVTDRCDFRCFYCIPKGYNDFVQPESWLTLDQIVCVVRIFSELGISKVRLTGGEPLVRKDLPEMIERFHALPEIEDLSLSTNASQLAKYAAVLKENGVGRINVSLDSLNPETFKQITQGDLQAVIDGLMEAKRIGLSPIKINMVVMKGLNDHEISDMVNFCLEHDFTLRFIETMPIGEGGVNATDYYVSLDDVRAELESKHDLEPTIMRGAGPATYLRVKGTNLRIGFITPMSQHFCETCNRVRLTVEGTLFLCLGQQTNVELRPLLQQGISDEELKDVLRKAIQLKPKQHDFQEEKGGIARVMSLTGG